MEKSQTFPYRNALMGRGMLVLCGGHSMLCPYKIMKCENWV
jgi:hypothetical protein